MSLLLLCFEPATTAASMAIDRRKTIGDAPARAAAQAEDAGVKTFLPREEWALAQGKKVLCDGVAAQTIEA
jgi:23S rRNA C2498 (ribose-2'-O)-methylase RlmM